MAISLFIRKVRWYHNKHGWAKLIKLAAMKVRDCINKKEYINLLDLNMLEVDNTLKQDGVTVECYNKESDIPANDMKQLIKLKSEELLLAFLNKFFTRSATIWLAKKDGCIVSLIWSLNGGFNGFYTGMFISEVSEAYYYGLPVEEQKIIDDVANKTTTQILEALSVKDKKLCAYLRLGLSSKEISGLLNITPKSVEIARVRLRKKLRLIRKIRLVNYLGQL